MSIYGYLNCQNCRHRMWLGKAIHQEYRPHYFHIGENDGPSNWQQEQLNQVLWKFLSDHCGHRIDVRLEHDMTDDMWSYKDIGGDGTDDVSFEQYLDGWPGNRGSRRAQN